MTPKNRYHGGLQFKGNDRGALERFANIVAATLEDYGHLVERKTLLSTSKASIVSSQYLVSLTLETDTTESDDRHERLDRAAGLKTLTRKPVSRPKNRLFISMSPVSPLLDDNEISELMLVVILYRMVDICSSQRVEWLSPNTVLTVEQFMSAFDELAPRPARDRKQVFEAVSGQFAGMQTPDAPELELTYKPRSRPIHLTDDQLLSIAFRTESEFEPEETLAEEDTETPSDIQRLTSWGMTGVVASLSLPVALSMAAVNLIKGEDFRLNTQVLSYTSAIVVLQSTGAMAGIGSALGM